MSEFHGCGVGPVGLGGAASGFAAGGFTLPAASEVAPAFAGADAGFAGWGAAPVGGFGGADLAMSASFFNASTAAGSSAGTADIAR